MDHRPSVVANSYAAKRAHSDGSDAFDFTFSLENEDSTEAKHRTLSLSSHGSYDNIPLSSESSCNSPLQAGYVMVSYPNHGVRDEDTFTGTETPDAALPTRSRTVSRRKRGVNTRTPLIDPPSSSLPAAVASSDDELFFRPQTHSPTHLCNPPQQGQQEYRYQEQTPEPPTTPSTRHFRESMLSLLSLLPADRYPSSPSPSVYGGDYHYHYPPDYQYEEVLDNYDLAGSLPVPLSSPAQSLFLAEHGMSQGRKDDDDAKRRGQRR